MQRAQCLLHHKYIRKGKKRSYLINKASIFWFVMLALFKMLFETPYTHYLSETSNIAKGQHFFQLKYCFLNSDLSIIMNLRTKYKKTDIHCKGIWNFSPLFINQFIKVGGGHSLLLYDNIIHQWKRLHSTLHVVFKNINYWMHKNDSETSQFIYAVDIAVFKIQDFCVITLTSLYFQSSVRTSE